MSNLYYMRDNHTFRSLPLDVEKALQAVHEEFDAGYTYGMLCSKLKGVGYLHANGSKRSEEFFMAAREWLQDAVDVAIGEVSS